jgi:hypothetical protein
MDMKRHMIIKMCVFISLYGLYAEMQFNKKKNLIIQRPITESNWVLWYRNLGSGSWLTIQIIFFQKNEFIF